MTGSLRKIDIRGKEGLSLERKWAAGPITYLGLAVASFPNLFIVTGPGSPSVLTNMVQSIEQHVDWIVECITNMHNRGAVEIDAKQSAESAWGEAVRSAGESS